MKPDIQSMLVLSTAHVRGATARLLDCEDDSKVPVALMRWSYGWLVWADDGVIADNDLPDLAACLALAKAHGCAWVRFDVDGPIVDALPSYADTWDAEYAGAEVQS